MKNIARHNETVYQDMLARQVMAKHPGMTVEEALAHALATQDEQIAEAKRRDKACDIVQAFKESKLSTRAERKAAMIEAGRLLKINAGYADRTQAEYIALVLHCTVEQAVAGFKRNVIDFTEFAQAASRAKSKKFRGQSAEEWLADVERFASYVAEVAS